MTAREVIAELYESLKGNSRMIQGQLTIEGFNDEDYENLWRLILEELRDAEILTGDYEFFYRKWAGSYYQKFLRDRNSFYGYCPQYEKPLDGQTIREQLVVLKHFVQRRFYSRYAR